MSKDMRGQLDHSIWAESSPPLGRILPHSPPPRHNFHNQTYHRHDRGQTHSRNFHFNTNNQGQFNSRNFNSNRNDRGQSNSRIFNLNESGRNNSRKFNSNESGQCNSRNFNSHGNDRCQNKSNARNFNRSRNSYQGNATKRPVKLVNDCLGGGQQSQISNLNPSTEVCSLTTSRSTSLSYLYF